MPISTRIDALAGIVWLHESGTAHYHEWEDALAGVSRDPEFRHGLRYLIDGRGLTTAPTREEVQRGVDLMRQAAHTLGAARWALVARESKSTTFGTMRMAEILAASQGLKVRAFLDVDQAVHWLTRDPHLAD